MPRPQKKRRISKMPKILRFESIEKIKNLDDENAIILSLDEYEVIRLMDYNDLNQEETAMIMGVARTTVQAIYKEARKKLSLFLIEGKNLEIRGGEYDFSFGQDFCGHCHLFSKEYMAKHSKGLINEMEIIIPVEENNIHSKISDSLGRAEFYAIYDIEKDEFRFIENDAKLSNSGAGIKSSQILVDSGARILLTPRCGIKAGKVLDACEFKIYETISDNLLENIDAYKENRLEILTKRAKGNHGGN